jgi:hypothetical protein
LFSDQSINAPFSEKTMTPIDLFQGFVSLVRLAEAKDIKKQAAGSMPIVPFQFRDVAGVKVRELPALREWIRQSAGRMAHIGEEVQGTGLRISEIPGKSPEEEIGEVVFWTKIEDHVIHPDRGIAIEAIKKTENVFQHERARALSVQGSRREVMDHPGPLIGPENGDMAIDPSVTLVGEVGLDLLIFLVEFTICFLEVVTGRLEKMVFLGIDETCVE